MMCNSSARIFPSTIIILLVCASVIIEAKIYSVFYVSQFGLKCIVGIHCT